MKSNKNYFRYIVYLLILVAVILFIVLILKSEKARAALFITIFIFLNMILSSYKRIIKLPIELEFLTLGIVISTIQFGLKAGLVIAILGGILSFIVSFNISPFSFPMLIGYISMAFISFMMKDLNIILIGLVASAINNLFVFISYHFLFNYDPIKNLSFSISNLLLNFILFVNLGPILIKVIS